MRNQDRSIEEGTMRAKWRGNGGCRVSRVGWVRGVGEARSTRKLAVGRKKRNALEWTLQGMGRGQSEPHRSVHVRRISLSADRRTTSISGRSSSWDMFITTMYKKKVVQCRIDFLSYL